MAFNNRLLRALSLADQEVLRAHLRWSELERGTVLVSPDEPISRVWFPESGLTSIIAMAGSDQGIEVGLAGRDGIVGMPLILDADRTPHRIFMQVSGAAYSVDGDIFRQVLDDHASI
jgi:CRP-like cAMP-binding protein